MGTLGGMFLATELGQEQELPSFFEIFMQDRITQSLKPAVHHVAQVVAERHPRLIPLLIDRFDEAYALLSLAVERAYLHSSDALFAEALYGFKRCTLTQGSKMSPLTPGGRRRALALAVLLPYVRSKLQALHARCAEDLALGYSGRGARLRRAFAWAYPLLHASLEASSLAYQGAYLLGLTKHYSPTLRLLRMVVRRLTPEDLEQAKLQQASSEPSAMGYAKVALVLAVVAFKVLEWWTLTPEARPRTRRTVPPPPEPPAPSPLGLPLPRDPRLCPLCRQPRVNPAVSPAGVAFCYRCLVGHVREHGASCPVSLVPCKEESIRRLFLD